MSNESQTELKRIALPPLGTKKLTDKQAIFVQEYLTNGFKHKQAAEIAGYSDPGVSGCQLIKTPRVQDAIKQGLHDYAITPERIKIALAEIAFCGDISSFEKYLQGKTSLGELKRMGYNTKLIKSCKISHTQNGTNVQLELYNRLDALEKLGRTLGIFTDNLNIESEQLKQLSERERAEYQALATIRLKQIQKQALLDNAIDVENEGDIGCSPSITELQDAEKHCSIDSMGDYNNENIVQVDKTEIIDSRAHKDQE